MSMELFSLPAVILVSLTSLALLISWNWRSLIVALSLQYVGVFVLVGLDWPIPMAASKLVAGWMAGAVLGMALIAVPSDLERGLLDTDRGLLLSGRVFRVLAAGMVALAVLSVSSKAIAWVPGIDQEQLVGALILICVGLLHLGLTAQPVRTVVGLLTILSGFEILYAAVETSALVSGLLAGVTLGLAVAGAYLVLAPTMEEQE
jgi:hypothetical protein